jgi:hypothetical protein
MCLSYGVKVEQDKRSINKYTLKHIVDDLFIDRHRFDRSSLIDYEQHKKNMTIR